MQMRTLNGKIRGVEENFEKQTKKNTKLFDQRNEGNKNQMDEMITRVQEMVKKIQEEGDAKVAQMENQIKQQVALFKADYEAKIRELEGNKLKKIERKVSFYDERIKESESITKELKAKISEQFEAFSKDYVSY